MVHMTRATYRRQHAVEIKQYEKEGIEVDVSHIISESNGGGNDSDNYILANAEFNKAIGNKWDELMIYVAFQQGGIERIRKAIRASPNSGFRVGDAERLVEKGRQEWNRRCRNCNRMQAQSYRGG